MNTLSRLNEPGPVFDQAGHSSVAPKPIRTVPFARHQSIAAGVHTTRLELAASRMHPPPASSGGFEAEEQRLYDAGDRVNTFSRLDLTLPGTGV